MDQWAKDTDNQMGNTPKLVEIFLFSLFPLTGMFLLGCTIYLIYTDIAVYTSSFFNVVMDCIMFLTPAVFFLRFGYVLILCGFAKYRFEMEGIRVKYPLRRSFIIPWVDFQQVCVCYTAYTTFGPRKANTVICAVKHGETPNFYGRWKANPFHYKTVLTIEYREDRYKALCEACPVKVDDLRNTLPYRL